jgi:hypothetical protein
MPLVTEYGEREFPLVKACVDYIRRHRSSSEPFDVVYASDSPGDRPDEAADIVGRFRDAGVTWWLESIAPYRFKGEVDDPWDFELLRERVLQGPPAV